MTTIFLLIALAVYAACCELDVRWSERAFAAGSQEGNEIIVKLFGKQPKSWQLRVYNSLSAVVFIAPIFLNVDAIDLAVAGFVTLAAGKHLMAVRKAALQVEGKYKVPTSAFAKFLGL